jgi:L-galactono-1,4-lactone dehydrogenase
MKNFARRFNVTNFPRLSLLRYPSLCTHSSSSYSTENPGLLVLSALIFSTIVFNSNNHADCEMDERCGIEYHSHQVYTNWSGTHTCKPLKVYEPKSPQQVLRLLQYLELQNIPLHSHHSSHSDSDFEKARPIGTSLSPNGIAMPSSPSSSVISLTAFDKIFVNPSDRTITVGAGVTVDEILKKLAQYDLTLENFSSIREQQIAGWTQVAAHGTGCFLSTVEEMIVSMNIATPTQGILTLSKESYPDLFQYAKVAMGTLGVVTQVTLKCIPKHSLLEHTYVTHSNELSKEHYPRLSHYRHVRYMWLPYTTGNQVVVVVSNPVLTKKTEETRSYEEAEKEFFSSGLIVKMTDPVQRIIKQWQERNPLGTIPSPIQGFVEYLSKIDLSLSSEETKEALSNLSFTQLRDRLLEYDPFSYRHIRSLNNVEAEFWRYSSGSRLDDSSNILGFDCGGEQFVYEVCFPIGSLQEKSGKDIEFMEKLLKVIEMNNIPSPSPLEQRWTARSTSKMSPAYSNNPNEIFCWVGIIMYIPKTIRSTSASSEEQNDAEGDYDHDDIQAEVKRQFQKYVNLIQPLCEEYQAIPHWGKVEIPYYIPLTDFEKQLRKRHSDSTRGGFYRTIWEGMRESLQGLLPISKEKEKEIIRKEEELDSDEGLLNNLRKRLSEKYPLNEFNSIRKILDPKGILSNDLLDTLLTPVSSSASSSATSSLSSAVSRTSQQNDTKSKSS